MNQYLEDLDTHDSRVMQRSHALDFTELLGLHKRIAVLESQLAHSRAAQCDVEAGNRSLLRCLKSQRPQHSSRLSNALSPAENISQQLGRIRGDVLEKLPALIDGAFKAVLADSQNDTEFEEYSESLTNRQYDHRTTQPRRTRKQALSPSVTHQPHDIDLLGCDLEEATHSSYPVTQPSSSSDTPAQSGLVTTAASKPGFGLRAHGIEPPAPKFVRLFCEDEQSDEDDGNLQGAIRRTLHDPTAHNNVLAFRRRRHYDRHRPGFSSQPLQGVSDSESVISADRLQRGFSLHRQSAGDINRDENKKSFCHAGAERKQSPLL